MKLFFALSLSLFMNPQWYSSWASHAEPLEARAQSLLDRQELILSLEEQDQRSLFQGSSQAQPWTSSYWPDILGGIANPYRSIKKLNAQSRFLLRYKHAKKRLLREFKETQEDYWLWDDQRLNRELSPAAKYDLLIENENFEFSKNVLEELEFRAEHRNSRLEDGSRVWNPKRSGFAYWSGICDGWAPASLYLPRPTKPVSIQLQTGKTLTFFPEDLKALGSYLYARTNTPYFATLSYRFAGGRCNERGTPDITSDSTANDQLLSQNHPCNDLNPALWHLALTHRIGLDRSGFVMDIDNNQKVNNHPVFKYELSFFHADQKRASSWRQALQEHHRSDLPHVQYRVGVKSKVFYLNYTWAEKRAKQVWDDPSQDEIKTVTYRYFLDLDKSFKIVGGEWLTPEAEAGETTLAKQPDFIWMAPLHQKPYSEMSLSTYRGEWLDQKWNWAWNPGSRLPDDWLTAARADQQWKAPELGQVNSKLKSPQLLSNIIYVLFEMAR